jgi:DNA-binding NarL/FixJ family response regulator
MPLLNGLGATRQSLLAHPVDRVLVLSAYSDDAYVDQVMGLSASTCGWRWR